MHYIAIMYSYSLALIEWLLHKELLTTFFTIMICKYSPTLRERLLPQEPFSISREYNDSIERAMNDHP